MLDGNIEIAARAALQNLARANRVGRARRRTADLGCRKTGGQFKRVREKAVTQQNRNLVAPVDRQRPTTAPQLRFVNNVVMHKRRQVDHLDNDRDGPMSLSNRSNGLAAEAHEHGAKLFSLGGQSVASVSGNLRFKLVGLRPQPGGDAL